MGEGYCLTLSVLVVILSCSNGSISPSTLSCDSLESCSPAQCIKNTEADCESVESSYDFGVGVGETACTTCTQSTSTRCTTLAATLKKNSGVAAAYCTDSFLVIWATGLPEHLVTSQHLQLIPLPPGGDAMCRVRTGIVQPNVYKIPITGVDSPVSGSNTIPNPLSGVPGMPEAGAIGVALDGVAMFPNYNNRGLPAWVSCEVDRCNAHGGKGFDYHYHGDPFGTNCMYDTSNYSGDHPPLIGFSLDGYSIHGKYISTTSFADGIDQDLDSCGGHSHSTYGYHYHSVTEENVVATEGFDEVTGSTGLTYTAYRLGPAECWKGDVSTIANFWGSSQANYDRSKSSVAQSTDYEQLRPCCGSTSYAVADGVSLNGAGACGDSDCSLGAMSTVNGPVSNTDNTSAPTSSGGSSSGSCSGTDDMGNACPTALNGDGLCPPGCTLVSGTTTSTGGGGGGGCGGFYAFSLILQTLLIFAFV